MGVDAPLYGRVTSGMICGYGEPVRLDRFIHPRVESEIAFLGNRSGARRGWRQCHIRVRRPGFHRGGRRLTSWGR